MSTDDEKREFFRIRDRIPLEFRIITREEFIALEDTIRYNSTQVIDRLHEPYFLDARTDAGDEGDHMMGYMHTINRKLDMIIELLGKSTGNQKMTALHTEVIISGSGIQFSSNVPFEKEQLVELKIIIPVYPYPKITCLCQVVHIEEGPESGVAASCVAFKFLVINEKDQDILINYIFLKERQYLRQQKETAS